MLSFVLWFMLGSFSVIYLAVLYSLWDTNYPVEVKEKVRTVLWPLDLLREASSLFGMVVVSYYRRKKWERNEYKRTRS